jgi:hypothetical protein
MSSCVCSFTLACNEGCGPPGARSDFARMSPYQQVVVSLYVPGCTFRKLIDNPPLMGHDYSGGGLTGAHGSLEAHSRGAQVGPPLNTGGPPPLAVGFAYASVSLSPSGQLLVSGHHLSSRSLDNSGTCGPSTRAILLVDHTKLAPGIRADTVKLP